MTGVLTRRKLLFGNSRLSNHEDVVRPPWSVDYDLFEKKCSGCAQCIPACPNHILTLDTRHLAKVDFQQGECIFCEECARVCDDGAIVITDINLPWHLDVSIEGKCLAMQSVECRVCEDQCEERAIRFHLTQGGVSTPQLNLDLCTGCGACVGPCPVAAITVRPETVKRTRELSA